MIFEVKNKLTKETVGSDLNKLSTRNAYMSSVGFDFLKKYRNGEWITGYNIEDPQNLTEREKILLEEKKELEKLLMKSLDEKNPDNEYLLEFRVFKYFDDGTMPTYDDNDPLGLLTIRAALAGGIIAPNKESVGQGLYSRTLFYFESKEVETSKKKIMNQLRNKASAILEKNSSVREWLLCMGFKLGVNVKPNFEDDTIYNMLCEKKEEAKTEKQLNELITTLSTSIKDIDNLFVVKQGINSKFLKFDNSGSEYLFEGIKVGKTLDESLLFFSKDVNSELFNSLRKKVYKEFHVN
jgi:hypothetical protein